MNEPWLSEADYQDMLKREPIPTVTVGDPISRVVYLDKQLKQEVVVLLWPDGTYDLAGDNGEVVSIGQEAMRQIARAVLSVAGEWSSAEH